MPARASIAGTARLIVRETCWGRLYPPAGGACPPEAVVMAEGG